ncbi:MAG: class I SAM-dependent methyltransferase [Cyanobacteriota bacterium]|nr:class I SAM-dependent methyltransferase [Cyanobacteriota bacterium]
MQWYKEDLAYIHDAGYGNHARQSAAAILDIWAENRLPKGLIVELGCGTGLSSLAFAEAGYDVLGVDISQSAIAIARTRVPKADFRVQSLFEVDIPSCCAVTAIGEVLNYLFATDGDRAERIGLFNKIYNALIPGGIFVFDIAEPGQVQSEKAVQEFTEGEDWVVLVEKEEDRDRAILSRRIVTFRQVGEYYRRDEEIHRQRLYRAIDLAKELRQTGFEARIARGYGDYLLPPSRRAIVAHKPR